ncbi:hypothetical protein FGB62_159g11 [Gracilaria domingensis]|nr:hypothetical protein FGB62_159g11 [Gracilaria domingensis]
MRRHERPQYGQWLYGDADCLADVFVPTDAELHDARPIISSALCIVNLRLLASPAVVAERMAEQEAMPERYSDVFAAEVPRAAAAIAQPRVAHEHVHDASAPRHQADADVMLFFCGKLLIACRPQRNAWRSGLVPLSSITASSSAFSQRSQRLTKNFSMVVRNLRTAPTFYDGDDRQHFCVYRA